MSQWPPNINFLDNDDDDDNFGGFSPPAIDEFGLPLNMGQAAGITSSLDGPNGEVSNARSIGIAPSSYGGFDAMLAPPPTLTSQPSLGGIPVEPSAFDNKKDLCDDDFGSAFLSPPSLSGIILDPPCLKQEESLSFCKDSLFFDSSSKKASPALKVTSAAWKLPKGSIKPVPDFYPLEQSSVFVEGSTPSEIAVRVSDCLRRRSIAASYGEVKAKAKCKTMDGVEFRVRMYSGRAEYSHGVIVEVQRRNGWSAMFQQDVFAILEAAEDKKEESFDMSIPPIDDLMCDSFDEDFSSGAESLPLNLIQSKDFDTKMAGMEILGAVTDVEKVGMKTARRNVSSIFHDSNKTNLRNMMIGLIGGNEGSDDESIDNTLHILALKVLSNCVELLAKERNLGVSVQEESWLINELLPIVIGELRIAKDTPNEAVLAAKCMKSLLSNTKLNKSLVSNHDVLPVLSRVMEIGSATHYGLQHEASQCVSLLQCR